MEWFEISNAGEIPSPALLIYKERVQTNIRSMLQMAKAPDSLRPHLKTCKSPPVTKLLLDAGITRFKCATIAEAEMAAMAGAPDILIAYPLCGPNIQRFHKLAEKYQNTKFSFTIDSEEPLHDLKARAEIYLDLNCGMNRTGVTPDDKGEALYRKILDTPLATPGGLHAYDGHVTNPDPQERRSNWLKAMEPVWKFKKHLESSALPVPNFVAGGSPTFPFHAERPGVQCSPGTTVFWDAGYSTKFADLPFIPAALVMTRVVSNPSPGRFCLDLGHKGIAAENPHPRVVFVNLTESTPVMHSEEHLVIETETPLRIGQELYGIPWHVCPTVALYSEAFVVENGRVSQTWNITSRARRITC